MLIIENITRFPVTHMYVCSLVVEKHHFKKTGLFEEDDGSFSLTMFRCPGKGHDLDLQTQTTGTKADVCLFSTK